MTIDFLRGQMQKLNEQIKQLLDYLEKPILHEGVVTHENDSFCLDGMILHDGQCVEILTKDEYTKKYVWKECFVKYPGESHSLVQAGVKGRIRE